MVFYTCMSMFLKPPTFIVSRNNTSDDTKLLNISSSTQMISAKIMIEAENAIK